MERRNSHSIWASLSSYQRGGAACDGARPDTSSERSPAWEWIIPTGVPIYAVRGGTVASVSAWPHNWWEQGCSERGRNGCSSCGIGVTVGDDTDNTRWTYCHGSDLHVTYGSRVDAGALLITSGNTGRSGKLHLHLEIRTTDGVRRCPQRLLIALLKHGGVDPALLPSASCSY